MTRYLFLIVALIVSGCGSRPAGNSAPGTSLSPAAAASPAQSVATDTDDKNNVDKLARSLVGLDNGGKVMADADDIHVKRTRFLLETLVRLTGESPLDISATTDAAATGIREDYGKNVSREKLLEEMKVVYADPKIAEAKPQYREAIAAQIMLEYAK